MIDIHCHILPGVDDGAQDVEMSVAMARAYVADGVRTVIATSHYCYSYRTDRELVHAKLDVLRKEFARQAIDLKLLPGNEVRLENTKFFYDALEHGRFSFLGGDHRSFLLLEQSWEGFNPDTFGIVKELLDQGTRPVLAHPERHPFFRSDAGTIERLADSGAWLQVNVGSLLGENGPDAQAFAFALADRGLIHTLASDAHNLKRRPNLSLGFRAIEQRLGPEAAQAIRGRMEAIAQAASADSRR